MMHQLPSAIAKDYIDTDMSATFCNYMTDRLVGLEENEKDFELEKIYEEFESQTGLILTPKTARKRKDVVNGFISTVPMNNPVGVTIAHLIIVALYKKSADLNGFKQRKVTKKRFNQINWAL